MIHREPPLKRKNPFGIAFDSLDQTTLRFTDPEQQRPGDGITEVQLANLNELKGLLMYPTATDSTTLSQRVAVLIESINRHNNDLFIEDFVVGLIKFAIEKANIQPVPDFLVGEERILTADRVGDVI